MRRLARGSILLLASVTLAACGAGDDREASAPAGTGTASTRLDVRVTHARPEPLMLALTCGGSTPCDEAALKRLGDALSDAEDPARVCTLQYGGPEEAHVTGTLEGRAVDVELTRANGCGIAGYEALFAAFDRAPPLAG